MNRSSYRLFSVLFLASFLLLSCMTRPAVHEFELQDQTKVPLDQGMIAYMEVNVHEFRPVLDSMELLQDKQTANILDRTDSILLAAYPNDHNRRMMLVTQGTYPVFWTSLSLGFNRSWKKVKDISGEKYWHSETEQLSLVLDSERVVVSDSLPFLQTPEQELPENLLSVRRNAALWISVEQPQYFFTPLLGELSALIKIPAKRILIIVQPDSDAYDALFRIEASSEKLGGAMRSFHSLASSMIAGIQVPDDDPLMQFAKDFFSASAKLDGSDLLVKLEDISSEKISLLLQVLSVYSVR